MRNAFSLICRCATTGPAELGIGADALGDAVSKLIFLSVDMAGGVLHSSAVVLTEVQLGNAANG
jgi:hypothetical protein